MEHLTTREKEILALVAKGLSNREIAGELELQPQTVHNAVSRIYSKIEVKDRVNAVLWMQRNGG